MKTTFICPLAQGPNPLWTSVFAIALLAAPWPSLSESAEPEDDIDAAVTVAVPEDLPAAEQSDDTAIRSLRPISREPLLIGQTLPEPGEVAWLGVATQEAPEVLTSQLNLEPGVGLVVTFVAEDSPAAKAGLERNDLLVSFEDQSLVLPAQLRKLVQSRKEGDAVHLTFYRNGKQQEVEASLGKTRRGVWGDAERWKEQLRGLERYWREIDVGKALREPLAEMERSLGDLRINQREIQEQVRGAIEEAHRAATRPEVREQVRRAMEEARHALREAQGAITAIAIPSTSGAPAPPGVHPPNITVRSSGSASQSVVRADETGTVVLVRNPKLRLTAHDPEGKLLFDGEIETEEQRATVPPDLWEKVEPLVDKMSAEKPVGPVQPLPAPPPRPEPGTGSRRGTI